MSTPYGKNIKLYIDGGSHDKKMTMRFSGFPAGFKIDIAELEAFMKRRAPGQNAYSTSRREADKPVFLSGTDKNYVTDGGEITAVIYNENQRSSDYGFNDTPRPGHADYAAVMKYGADADLRGGGHFSGRLTAMLCIAGNICMQYLKASGINIFAHIYSVGDVYDTPFDGQNVGKAEETLLFGRDFKVLDYSAGEKMLSRISEAKACLDSVGGIVECAVTGLKPGLGEHMFAGVEGRISQIVFGIPAVKGIEFGAGFSSARMKGSENNDPYCVRDGKIITKTNNCGGILGGMTDGAPLIFRAAVKPTPSIGTEQDSVSVSKAENVKITVGGRHDPCIVPRAVPVFEAAAAIAVFDIMTDGENG